MLVIMPCEEYVSEYAHEMLIIYALVMYASVYYYVQNL